MTDETIGSCRPWLSSTLVAERSASPAGSNGVIARSSTAPAMVPGFESSTLAAMLAPLEKPTAYRRDVEKLYRSAASSMNRASSSVRACRSSRSNTPSAKRRKKRGAPCSRTLPRGLRSAAPGAIRRPRGRRSDSSPPVPCSRSSVIPSGNAAGSQWCWCRSSALILAPRRPKGSDRPNQGG